MPYCIVTYRRCFGLFVKNEAVLVFKACPILGYLLDVSCTAAVWMPL